MHTLYSFPFSCALAVQITLARYGVPFELEQVDRGGDRKTAEGPFTTVNAKRKVPALRLPDGEILTEIVAILHHLDTQHAPVDARTARRRLERLAFLSSEVHQQVLGPTFDRHTPSETLDDLRSRVLPPVLADLERLDLDARDGADAYLVWTLLLLRFRWPEALSPKLSAHLDGRLQEDAVGRAVRQARKAWER